MRRAIPVLLAGLASPALAQGGPQPGPQVTPLRDVMVTYRVEGAARDSIPGGIPDTLRLSWDAAGRRLRAEAEGRSQAVLLDLRARSALVVDSAMRAVMKLPVRAADLEPLTLEGARLTRLGTETVAGLACTNYDVQSHRGAGRICLTNDGVALRASGTKDGRSGSFTALSVQYGPQPPARFQVPPGYFQLALPNFGRFP